MGANSADSPEALCAHTLGQHMEGGIATASCKLALSPLTAPYKVININKLESGVLLS